MCGWLCRIKSPRPPPPHLDRLGKQKRDHRSQVVRPPTLLTARLVELSTFKLGNLLRCQSIGHRRLLFLFLFLRFGLIRASNAESGRLLLHLQSFCNAQHSNSNFKTFKIGQMMPRTLLAFSFCILVIGSPSPGLDAYLEGTCC